MPIYQPRVDNKGTNASEYCFIFLSSNLLAVVNKANLDYFDLTVVAEH